MNEALKKRWVSALKSGRYKQRDGALCNADNGERQYCCLGVLKEVALSRKLKLIDLFDFGFPHTTKAVNLSPWYLKRFGLTNTQQTALAQMNDGGMTFKQIAYWIEENL